MFRKIVLPLWLSVALLLACSVAYFPPYDAGIVSDATALKVQTLAFIDSGARDAAYFKSAYAQLDDLWTAASAYQHNEPTIGIIDNLKENMILFQELAEGDPIPPEAMLIIRSTLGAQFDQLIDLENAKRKEVQR